VQSHGQEEEEEQSGDGVPVTAEMMEKTPSENRGVCLISVHDGLCLFRGVSVIHPSLISPFEIAFAQLDTHLHTKTLTPRGGEKKKVNVATLQCKNET